MCWVGCATSAAWSPRPGVIRQESPFRRVVLGEMPWSPDRGTSRRGCETWPSTCSLRQARWPRRRPTSRRHAGPSLRSSRPSAGWASVTRVPAGEINATPETRQLLRAAIAEVVAVAAAEGVPLPGEPCEDDGLLRRARAAHHRVDAARRARRQSLRNWSRSSASSSARATQPGCPCPRSSSSTPACCPRNARPGWQRRGN